MSTTVKVIAVLLPILLGQVCRLTKLFGDEEGKLLSRFVIRLTVPILVFFSMYDADKGDFAAAPILVAALVLVTAIRFAAGYGASRFFAGAPRRAGMHACVTFANYGWLGYGVTQALLGDDGLRRAMFFLMLWWPVFFGFGAVVGLVQAGEGKSKFSLGSVLKIALPVAAALVGGLTLGAFDCPIPGVLQDCLRPFARMTIPLILFSVGLTLDLRGLRGAMKPALAIAGFSLVVGPLVGWLVASMLTRDPLSYKVIILESAMPVAAMTPVLGDYFEMDLEVVNSAVVVSTVLAMATLPVLAALLL